LVAKTKRAKKKEEYETGQPAAIPIYRYAKTNIMICELF